MEKTKTRAGNIEKVRELERLSAFTNSLREIIAFTDLESCVNYLRSYSWSKRQLQDVLCCLKGEKLNDEAREVTIEQIARYAVGLEDLPESTKTWELNEYCRLWDEAKIGHAVGSDSDLRVNVSFSL